VSNRFTTVKHTSWFGNITNSAVGAVFGVLIFLLAFPVIWIGEGRTNMAEVAATSVVASATNPSPADEGKLVAVTGVIEADPLGDGGLLVPGPYLRLERVAEMYAWVEERETERQDNVGGGSTERTTYSYELRWTSSPESGDDFYEPSGHRNPPMPVEGATLSAAGGQLGSFVVDLDAMGLPSAKALPLSAAMVERGSGYRLAGDYLFRGKGQPDSPRAGDVRISYRAVPAGGEVTAFGAQRGDELALYRTPKGDELYRALEGGREAAIEQLQVEDTIFDWIFRIGALLMLWVGLVMLLGPVGAVLGVLPALRQASGCLTSVVAFAVAFVIWAVAELVAIVAHNPWLLAGAVILLVGGAILLAGRFKPGARTQSTGV
jgi:hypothetical protein